MNTVVKIECGLFAFVWGSWVASLVFAFTVNRAVELFFLTIPAGAGLVLTSRRFGAMLAWRKTEKIAQLLPENIDVNHNDDGTATLFVTKRNGDIVTLVTPEGYHPSKDGGSWVMDQLLPDKVRGMVDTYVQTVEVDDEEDE